MDPVSHERARAEQDAKEIEAATNSEDATLAAFRGLSSLLLDILSELRGMNGR